MTDLPHLHRQMSWLLSPNSPAPAQPARPQRKSEGNSHSVTARALVAPACSTRDSSSCYAWLPGATWSQGRRGAWSLTLPTDCISVVACGGSVAAQNRCVDGTFPTPKHASSQSLAPLSYSEAAAWVLLRSC